jgi:hypothetical protein
LPTIICKAKATTTLVKKSVSSGYDMQKHTTNKTKNETQNKIDEL